MKTLLFDLDGTLIKTTEIILETFVETFQKYFPEVELTDSVLTNMLGHTLFTTFGNYTDSKEKVDEIVTFYRKTSNEKIEAGLESYPKAKETLETLKKMGCTVGVVTSKMRHVATYHLELTGLLPYVDGLIGYEDTEKHKPNPDPLLKAMDLFDADPETTVYVGDHENDITAAKQANIASCAVTYSHRLKEMLQVNPEFVIDALDNIIDLV